MKRALITGASGQDGYYLTKLLLAKGYEVHFITRAANSSRVIDKRVLCHTLELTDYLAVERTCLAVRPDEIYNLASLPRPEASWDQASETGQVNAMVVHGFLDLQRRHMPACRLFQASSVDMYGTTALSSQNEATPFAPQNPYAIAKLYAHHMVSAYRLKYNIHANCGIMFNHDSPLRPLSFVTQKIAHAAAVIASNISNSAELDERNEPIVVDGRVFLGNLDVSRDFGFAGDYVHATWLMLQQEKPDDYVIGTGETHTVREICQVAFGHVGRNWSDHVVVDQRLVRNVDTRYTKADATKARNVLGWKPTVTFHQLIAQMVDARLEYLRQTRRP